MHESSEKFEIRPDLTTFWGVSCPWASEKIPIDLIIMGEMLLALYPLHFYWIIMGDFSKKWGKSVDIEVKN